MCTPESCRQKLRLVVTKVECGLTRDDVAYMMDTFPIVRSRDESEHGCYRTKQRILEIYDQMAAAKAARKKP